MGSRTGAWVRLGNIAGLTVVVAALALLSPGVRTVRAGDEPRMSIDPGLAAAAQTRTSPAAAARCRGSRSLASNSEHGRRVPEAAQQPLRPGRRRRECATSRRVGDRDPAGHRRAQHARLQLRPAPDPARARRPRTGSRAPLSPLPGLRSARSSPDRWTRCDRRPCAPGATFGIEVPGRPRSGRGPDRERRGLDASRHDEMDAAADGHRRRRLGAARDRPLGIRARLSANRPPSARAHLDHRRQSRRARHERGGGAGPASRRAIGSSASTAFRRSRACGGRSSRPASSPNTDCESPMARSSRFRSCRSRRTRSRSPPTCCSIWGSCS